MRILRHAMIMRRRVMYKSPIDIIEKQMHMEFDDCIWKTVQDYAVSVDKEELIKALRYDRDQYEKGYADGKRDAFDKLTRCKDCDYCHEYTKWNGEDYLGCNRLAEFCGGQIVEVDAYDFCSYMNRREV
jgi:hypothetical protein